MVAENPMDRWEALLGSALGYHKLPCQRELLDRREQTAMPYNCPGAFALRPSEFSGRSCEEVLWDSVVAHRNTKGPLDCSGW